MSILHFQMLPKIRLIAYASVMVIVLKVAVLSVSSIPSTDSHKRWFSEIVGIKTRLPIYYAAGFVLLGLLPKFGALAQIIL